MHPEAREGFARMLVDSGIDPSDRMQVLDLGGQNVNGTVHDLFTHPGTVVTTLDLENADIIADATRWSSGKRYDLVMATEVFEHVKNWRAVIETAWSALRPAGVLIATCASTNRPVHGATGAPAPAPGEWYENVTPDELSDVLVYLFHRYNIEYRYPPGDAYMWGVK